MCGLAETETWPDQIGRLQGLDSAPGKDENGRKSMKPITIEELEQIVEKIRIEKGE